MKTSIPAGLLALLLVACQPAPDAAPEAARAPESAAAAADPDATVDAGMPSHPTLVVETLDHGEFDLAAQRGQWVVVNFWATWCKPCLKEIPDLSAFDAARDDVRVIGLAYEEIEPADMRAFLEKHPAGYPVALLDVYDPPADFDTPRGLPMTYLVDPEGKVAKKYLGPITSQELAADIAAVAGPAQ
ncbi:MAG TPA: TlpA disulfide reductase family protein [Arenimonas sp.]|nr:TlpA disulfide reductase family protein [Arenimonas sp.]